MRINSPLEELPKWSIFLRPRKIESLEHLHAYHDKKGDVMPGTSMMEVIENDGDGWQFGASGYFVRDPEERSITLHLKGYAPDYGLPFIEARPMTDDAIQMFGAWVFSRAIVENPTN